MAQATIKASQLGSDLEDLRAALASLDGVRSVRERDGALEVDYDDTIVGENKLVEVSREHHAETAVPGAIGPTTTGMDPPG